MIFQAENNWVCIWVGVEVILDNKANAVKQYFGSERKAMIHDCLVRRFISIPTI
jgi:hypothetical protein